MEGPPAQPPRTRRLLLRIATLLSPVALLLALELALRAVGFGGGHPLFVPAPGMPGHLQANPELMRRYVSGGAALDAIEPIPFAARKPDGATRIVVQGASTAAGFPYGRWGGLAGMLGDRLEATFPEREIELVTTAMAAVTTWTLLDLVDEIIAIEPDAVLVYAGHNEYVGVLGVGSALTAQRSPAVVRLHLELGGLRLYQLLRRSIAGLRGGLAADAARGERDTLLAAAASAARVPYESDTYHRGIAQLESNLGELLARYREAGIPVYLGTLVRNEKDLPPFVGEGSGPDDAESADAWFARAERALAEARVDEARDAYRAAADRDELRLRAPSAFEHVIRTVAAEHDARLVEVATAFEDASPHGIPGDELLLEHVHPNARGYFLLADAYYEALRRDERIGDWSRAPSRREALRDMPITAIDRILGELAARELRSNAPFRNDGEPFTPPEPTSEIERLALLRRSGEIGWLDAMERLLAIHRGAGRIADAGVVARLAAQAYPAEHAPNHGAGVLMLRLGRPARAVRYLERAHRAAPEDAETLAALVGAHRTLGDAARARRWLEELARVAPGHPLVQRVDRQPGG